MWASVRLLTWANLLDVVFSPIVDYLMDDSDTKVIVLYIERIYEHHQIVDNIKWQDVMYVRQKTWILYDL